MGKLRRQLVRPRSLTKSFIGILLMIMFIVIVMMFPAAPLFSQAGGAALELRTESSPGNPVVNSVWTLTILVNHHNPYEVSITPPLFPPALQLQMIRIEGRSVQGQRWTSVEYSFVPLASGATALEPFSVIVGGRLAQTGVIALNIQPSALAAQHNPVFRWIEPVPALYSAERGELFLELSDWDSRRYAPAGIFQGRAPLNAILNETVPVVLSQTTPQEAASLAEGEAAAVYRYVISIIPLDESGVTLEPFVFQSGGFTLSVPGITIPVLPPRPAPPLLAVPPPVAPALPLAGIPVTAETPESPATIPFPDPLHTPIFAPLQDEYDRIIAAVRLLWEEGLRPQALAEIRRYERDSFAGPFLVSTRREMEQALGLIFTSDENWRPLRIPLLAWALLGFLALSVATAVFIVRLRNTSSIKNTDAYRSGAPVTSRRRRGFRSVIALVFSVGVIFVLLEVAWGRVSMRALTQTGRTAVLSGTAAFRIPDTQGTVNAWFDEGQLVILGAHNPHWRYVQSPDGRSGWVPQEAVINY